MELFIYLYPYKFQSTLPHGSDSHSIYYILVYSYFNPRSLTGATHGINIDASRSSISIHAPSRERLPGYNDLLEEDRYFNPRSLTGATLTATELLSIVEFQFTLPHGSDLCVPVKHAADADISIHAPSRERHGVSLLIDSLVKFQSTLPHGSDR